MLQQVDLNPSETASPFYFLFYSYISPLVRLAYKKNTLDISDLPPPLPNEKADAVKINALPVSFALLFLDCKF